MIYHLILEKYTLKTTMHNNNVMITKHNNATHYNGPNQNLCRNESLSRPIVTPPVISLSK